VEKKSIACMIDLDAGFHRQVTLEIIFAGQPLYPAFA